MPIVTAPTWRSVAHRPDRVGRASRRGDAHDRVVGVTRRAPPGRRRRRRRRPRRPRAERSTAAALPAITPTTRSVLNVGGHSAASRTPIRPARPGADVDQPPAAAQPFDDGVDRRGDAIAARRRWRRWRGPGRRPSGSTSSAVPRRSRSARSRPVLLGEQVGQVGGSVGSWSIVGVLRCERVGSKASRRPSPRRLRPITASDDRRRRAGHQPPAARHQRARLADHQPERRVGRLRAEAEEAQRRLGEDRPRQGQGDLDDDRRRDVGQDVTEQQAACAGSRARGRP